MSKGLRQTREEKKIEIIKRLWNANTADEISKIVSEYEKFVFAKAYSQGMNQRPM